MKKIFYALIVFVGIIAFSSCDDTETYADQKEKERNAINKYIADSAVNVISEATFFAQDSTTDVSKNEFVLFNSSGVYMQIIRKGCGEVMKDGETAGVLCRFNEWNLLTDSLQLSNNVLAFSSIVDKMSVTMTYGVPSGSFDTSSSIMYSVYGSAAVPSGWLTPLNYVKLGRPTNDGEDIAKVKLIVPHDRGQSYASSNVYPCLYEITYERGK